MADDAQPIPPAEADKPHLSAVPNPAPADADDYASDVQHIGDLEREMANQGPGHYEQVHTQVAQAEQMAAAVARGQLPPFDPTHLADVTPQSIYWLLCQWPFLQIINIDPPANDTPPEVKVVRVESGWDVLDYGQALASSPGRLIMGGYVMPRGNDDDDGDEGGGGGMSVNPHAGTIIRQAFDTAFDMVNIAIERGWSGIYIVDGHPLMQRAAWLHASENRLAVDGFTPDNSDFAVRSLLTMPPEELENRLKATHK